MYLWENKVKLEKISHRKYCLTIDIFYYYFYDSKSEKSQILEVV